MVKCYFCGSDKPANYGVHIINNDGTISYFCSSKCRKNSLKLKRDKRKVGWTEAYRLAKDKKQKKDEALASKK